VKDLGNALKNKELKHPVPASKWPDGFLAKELVKLTDGIIGAPTAYLIAKNIGDRYGRAYIIDKIKFFEWFLGMDNIYVQAMKRGTERGEAAGSSRRSYISGG